MRRLLVICAVTVAIFVAFAVARKHPAIAQAASSNPGNLLLTAAAPPQKGCALGPAFTFCDERPGTAALTGQGQFSVVATAAVTNVSVSLVAIPGLSANFAAGDFAITNNTCTGNLAANATCTISLAFSPTAAGLREAALVVTDAQGDTLSINIEGTGKNLVMAPPLLPLLPCPQGNAYTFCDEPVGGASSAAGFAVTAGSGGASGIGVSLAAIPGLESEFATGDFTIIVDGCTGTSLAADGSCSVSVEFTPTAAGLRSAALTATDAGGDTTTIYLAGHANSGLTLTPPATLPACTLGSALNFCNEPQGGQTATTAFTLTNTSGTQVTGIVVPTPPVPPAAPKPTDFTVVSTSCTAVLAAGANCQINVAFTPQGTGLRQGSLSVTDAQGDIGAANFAGTGTDYNLQLTSSQPLEVTVAAGGTATFSAQVIPDSVFGLNGEQVMFVCPVNLPANTNCAISPCPASITAGTPASFQITFVTSSAKTVAPVPTAACSGYGPVVTAASPGAPGPRLHFPGDPGTGARAPIFPAVGLLAILAMLALFFGRMDLMSGSARKRLPLMFACAGLAAAAIFVGCGGHGSTAATSATPPSTMTMQLEGNALDAHGNPLNTSRSLRIILNVTAK